MKRTKYQSNGDRAGQFDTSAVIYAGMKRKKPKAETVGGFANFAIRRAFRLVGEVILAAIIIALVYLNIALALAL